MPYKNSEQKRAHGVRYRAENKIVLAAKERARAEALKAADPEAWRQKVAATSRRFRAAHKGDEVLVHKNRERRKQWWVRVKDDPAVKQKNKARVAAFLKGDLQYRLGHALRTRMNTVLRKKRHSSSAIRDLGCSLAELIAHLEQRFQPGMSWENWSPRGWHIDHIRPLKSFDLTDPAQYAEACSYTNLQPLWASVNIGKGAKYNYAIAQSAIAS